MKQVTLQGDAAISRETDKGGTMRKLNGDGQAPSRFIRARQVADRSIDELLGLCKGVAADGRVCQDEALYMLNWLQANDHVRDKWPANIIRVRIVEYLEDGIVDQDEREELFDLMRQIVGSVDAPAALNFSTSLPFDDPQPDLLFSGQRFCLTGQFIFGPRPQCEREILSLGGSIVTAPRKSGCVVVVGLVGSRDWVHSTFGRKIETALDMRREGCPVSIVSEEHWTDCLKREFGFTPPF